MVHTVEEYLGAVIVDAPADAVANCRRLLHDFLQHEMRIATLFKLSYVKVQLLDGDITGLIVCCQHFKRGIATDYRYLVVIEIYNLIGIFDNW